MLSFAISAAPHTQTRTLTKFRSLMPYMPACTYTEEGSSHQVLYVLHVSLTMPTQLAHAKHLLLHSMSHLCWGCWQASQRTLLLQEWRWPLLPCLRTQKCNHEPGQQDMQKIFPFSGCISPTWSVAYLMEPSNTESSITDKVLLQSTCRQELP